MIRRRRARKDQRGVALVMVLGALTVLTVFLVELQEETSSELSAALAERDALKAEYHARSGVNLGRLVIASEGKVRAAIAPFFMLLGKKPFQIPVWEFSDVLLGPFNDASGAASFSGFSGIDTSTGKNLGIQGGGRFELRIVDEEAKINVNAAARGSAVSRSRLGSQLVGLISGPQYNELFEGRDGDDQFTDRATFCSAIVDWADPDEELFACDPTVASTGAEDSFYQLVGLDYRRKNAPLDSIDEIRLIRGMNEDTWATFVDPDPGDPSKRIMSVYGKEKINVTSANPLTLLGVICAPGVLEESPTSICNDPIQIQGFVMGMTLVKSIVPGLPVFTSGKDLMDTMEGKGMLGPILTQLGVLPVKFKSRKTTSQSLSNETKTLSIYSEGVVPGVRRTTRVRIHAVVDISKAEPPGAPATGLAGPTSPGQPGARINNAAVDTASLQTIASAMQTNPAGTIIYWRVE